MLSGPSTTGSTPMDEVLRKIAEHGRMARWWHERDRPLERAEHHALARELRDQNKGTEIERKFHEVFWEAYCNAKAADYLQMRIAKKNVFERR